MSRTKHTPKKIHNKGVNPRTRHVCMSLRLAVYDRDGGKCVKCGSTNRLQVDHIKPHSKGGITVLENLQTLCRMCNQVKGNK